MNALKNASDMMAGLNGRPALFIYPKNIKTVPVSATGDYTAELPLGVNYHRLWLKCETGASALCTKTEIQAAISEIELTVDADVKIQASATVLNNERDYDETQRNGGSADGYILIDLTKRMQLIQESYLLRYGTANINQINLKFTVASVAALAKVTVWADVDNEKGIPLGSHRIFKPVRISDESSGLQQVTSGLPLKNTNETLNKIHVMTSQCSKLRFDIGGAVYQPEMAKTQNDERLQHAGKTPVSGVYTLDLSMDNAISAGLFLPVSEYKLDLTMDAATTGGYNIYVDSIRHARG